MSMFVLFGLLLGLLAVGLVLYPLVRPGDRQGARGRSNP